MEQKRYAVIKDVFLNSYKTFIDCAALTHNGCSMYSILVLKTPTYDNLVKVNIIIRNSYSGDGILNEYSNNVILTKEMASNLIRDIRNDFENKYNIIYSSVNPRTLVHTLQNAKFSLNIKLNSDYEYKEAMEFNHKINSRDKKKVLVKN